MNINVMRVGVISAAYALTYVFAQPLGAVYVSLFPYADGGGFIGAPGMIEWVLGLPITLIFIVTLFVHTVGGRNVWWWNIGGAMPAVLFEIVLDPLHIYFPIILGFIAWGLGTMAHKALTKLAPSFMSKIA